MLSSVEARWFMAGAVPNEALDWIQRWKHVGSEPEKREDHYLSCPGIASVGLKLRDGKFEIKRRALDLGLIHLGPRVTGRLALWRKWSFKVVDDGGNKSPDGHWISVGKERHLCKYSIEGEDLKPVDPRSFPARGCTVELTRLQVLGKNWWSVGFEAFGPDESQLCDTLTRVAGTCFNVENCPLLRGEDSFDYPEWIGSLESDTER